MDTPDIARAITVLYRAEGHLRFRLPRELAREPAASHIERALLRLAGVRRAAVDRGHAKLSVHFDARAQPLAAIARTLFAAAQVAATLPPAAAQAAVGAPRPLLERLRSSQARRWLHGRAQALRQRSTAVVQRARMLTQAGRSELVKRSPWARVLGPEIFNERTILGFLNDIAALYLIKVHWNLITQRWLRAPFAHRYEWLTIVYLTYLFVRFRKQTQKAK